MLLVAAGGLRRRVRRSCSWDAKDGQIGAVRRFRPPIRIAPTDRGHSTVTEPGERSCYRIVAIRTVSVAAPSSLQVVSAAGGNDREMGLCL